jgi:hypothetical protein
LSFLLQILFLEAQSSPSKFLPCKEGRKEGNFQRKEKAESQKLEGGM